MAWKIEAREKTSSSPDICYTCSLATEENPIQECYVLEGIGNVYCVLSDGKCIDAGSCEDKPL